MYEILGSRGSIVVIEAEHLCMTARGVQKPGSITVTSAVRGIYEEDEALRAETMAFMTLALAQVAHAFNARSQRRTAFTSRLFTNGWLWGAVLACVLLQAAAASVPLLQRVLRTIPPSPSDWAVIAACSLAPVAVVELIKLVQNGARWGGARAGVAG